MDNGFSLNRYRMLRLGVASPEHRVADVAFNLQQILQQARIASNQGCQLLLFPELALTGYSCADLFYQVHLQQAALEAMFELARATEDGPALVVGLPIPLQGRLFNCAAFLSGGEVRGLVPKSFLPNTAEFYEQRWFCPARQAGVNQVLLQGEVIPFGTDLLFEAENYPECSVGIEICEDLWAVQPPSANQAVAGATLLLNPSASPEVLGKRDYRNGLVLGQSARCLAAYAYASAGPGESTTDLVYAGHSLIAEYGSLLAETERFEFTGQLALADVDLERLVAERQRNNSFADHCAPDFRRIVFPLVDREAKVLRRPVNPSPFVPIRTEEREGRCREIFAIQTTALARRLLHTGSPGAVIGISGGLDSTLALLVTVKAFDKLERDRKGILAVTMPGFGTTDRTRQNAERLAELLDVELQVISIDAAVRQHFADIGQDEKNRDITYENAQARERTQILMDLANRAGGLVVGTGDLSELALGWCTYNADHMSMYGVNAGVPKSLVRYLVDWCAEAEFSGPAREVLRDIGATPVSPELLPPDANGDIAQKTEETLGPYEVHDFFLYHMVRLQQKPDKILLLARQAFGERYPEDRLRAWLKLFYRRFFSQQFKRPCLPAGPKVGSVALSPRGDWRMPSDATVDLWLNAIEEL